MSIEQPHIDIHIAMTFRNQRPRSRNKINFKMNLNLQALYHSLKYIRDPPLA